MYSETRLTAAPATSASAAVELSTRRNTPWTALAMVAVVSLAIAVVCRPHRINSDVAYFIQCAQLLIDGRVPYVGYVDVNPPLIVYLNALPALVARELHLAPAMTFHLAVVLLMAAGTLALGRLLSRLGDSVGAPTRGLLLAAWVFASAWLWARDQFGQREHLFILAYVPFLMLRVVRYGRAQAVSPVFATAIGVIAGMGVCLKPFFLLPVVACEAALLLRYRRPARLREPELIALVVTGACYAVHFALVPREMRDAFFGRWVPLIRSGYRAYDMPGSALGRMMLTNPSSVIPLCIAVLGLTWFAVRRSALASLTGVFALLSIASAVGVVLQAKGWPYHLIPVWFGGLLCAATMFAAGAQGWAKRPRLSRNALDAGGLLLLLIATVLCLFTAAHHGADSRPSAFEQFVKSHTAAGDRVLVLSTSVSPAYPLMVSDDLRPGSRYLCAFPVPFFYFGERWPPGKPAYHDRARAPAQEQQFLADLETDIRTLRPVLIAIQTTGCQGCAPDFNLSDYFRHLGAVGAVIQPAYREVPSPAAGWHMYLAKPAAITGAPGARTAD